MRFIRHISEDGTLGNFRYAYMDYLCRTANESIPDARKKVESHRLCFYFFSLLIPRLQWE